MSDVELLELAAKAAGIDRPDFLHSDGTWVYTEPHKKNWNPLKDDGDALRLAVKCGFINPGQFPCPGYREMDLMIEEKAAADWYVAIRRAIVRAAAEIGRTEGAT